MNSIKFYLTSPNIFIFISILWNVIYNTTKYLKKFNHFIYPNYIFDK